MRKMYILADDLTGACDTGGKILARGLSVDVFLTGESFCPESSNAEVIAVNTDTRSLLPQQAEGIYRQLARALDGDVSPVIYKKVDSLLRGAVSEELQTLCRLFHYDAALLCPSLPEQGRAVCDGVLSATLADGSFLRFSALESLCTGKDGTVALLDIDTVRAGPRAVIHRVKALVASGAKLILADAVTQADVRNVASALSCGLRLLPAGSAGMIEAVYQALFPGEETTDVPQGFPRDTEGRILVLAGSISPVTAHQIQELKQVSGVEFFPVDVAGMENPEQVACLREAATAAILRSDAPVRVLLSQDLLEGKSIEIAKNTSNKEITELFAGIGRQVILRDRLGGLLLTGGETAQAFYRAAGISRLRLEREVMPGIISMCFSCCGQYIRAVTKSGSFGNRRTMVELVAQLRPNPQHPQQL